MGEGTGVEWGHKGSRGRGVKGEGGLRPGLPQRPPSPPSAHEAAFSPRVLSSSVQLRVRMSGVRYCRLTTVR